METTCKNTGGERVAVRSVIYVYVGIRRSINALTLVSGLKGPSRVPEFANEPFDFAGLFWEDMLLNFLHFRDFKVI